MPIPLDHVSDFLAELQTPQVENLFAQAHASHVLHEVAEAPENFPAFDPNLADKVTFLAYGLLAAGCSLIEQDQRSVGATHLERAASLLQYMHGPQTPNSTESRFHVLVGAMAFYAGGHYSRAFVSMRNVEAQTPAARVIGAFLRKDVHRLIERLNDVLLRELVFTADDDHELLRDWAIETGISRAIAFALEFIFTGNADHLVKAEEQLQHSAILAKEQDQAAWWWVVRLLQRMLQDLTDSSPWNVIPPYLGGAGVVDRYIRLLAFATYPISELWLSQRTALPLALNSDNRGAVLNLRTSAGKTRIAELAILQTLISDPSAQILYLAPFRSLALEIEHTLGFTFTSLGYAVSHLYGGSRVSSVDTELVAESNINIATPEKARALFRAAPELFERMKLLVIDEGHLIGPEERYVRNEIFVDHLRSLVKTTGARILLLSAVLPNPQELAEWVVGDASAVAISSWKPSAERFGLLRWNGSRVRIEWKGDVASFNPSFVEGKPLNWGRRRRPFPNNKNEAIAAAAIRLSTIGPIMIFTGRATSVSTLATAVLVGLGETPTDHPWPAHEWNVLETICQEELKADAIELRAARFGVICHSNRLTAQVRLALEHLMRSYPPKIIIATTTLAQGVNVGISAVIIATPFIGQNSVIDKRDFWNICGRAGRAFVDGEGKILYAIDDTGRRWQIQRDLELARMYFDAQEGDPVQSGLLLAVSELRTIADHAGIAFELLLELAANNDFSSLGEPGRRCAEICDLLDDELLALHVDDTLNIAAEEPALWVERVFRDSLAAIQARSMASSVSPDDVFAFLRARIDSAMLRAEDTARRALVSSGLPLTVALRAHANLHVFGDWADLFSRALETLVDVVKHLEEWTRMNASTLVTVPDSTKLDSVRMGWLAGIGLQHLVDREEDAKEITREFYGYYLPWIVHAASQQLRVTGQTEQAEALAMIALMLELGVPSELAARIFLAGVRSRSAATELAGLDAFELDSKTFEISRKLRNPQIVNELLSQVSEATAHWLRLLADDAGRSQSVVLPRFLRFTLPGSQDTDVLHARSTNNQIVLSSTDGRRRFNVQGTPDLPFDTVANDPRVAFVRYDDEWELRIRDPRVSTS